MSIKLGPSFHIGYAVPDMDQALAYWTQVMGRRPFLPGAPHHRPERQGQVLPPEDLLQRLGRHGADPRQGLMR